MEPPIEGYGMYKLQQKIYRTKVLLKRWNREVFGNVFTTVEQAKQEAEEAEKNFDRDPSETNLVALNKCNAALVHCLNRNIGGRRVIVSGSKTGKGTQNTFTRLSKKKKAQVHNPQNL
ncbi:UNVERIFIED_CONTAM: hypothetical protein Sangu_2655400 [Sesamum angustifolium]|uniref:Uncharacterized protein n=1 Tax=Sesamum angustifolium TaxID=2727405 RepID=A0AAW2J2I4_9LAMI